MPLALNEAAVATPFTSVVAAVVVVLLANVPLAALTGALKATTTPRSRKGRIDDGALTGARGGYDI
jgi:hypothetical protein